MPSQNGSNKAVLWMTFAVILGMVVLLVVNMVQILSNPKKGKYLPFNEVKGMAINHKGLLYTLNFDQQNSVIDYLNLSLPVGEAALKYNAGPLDFTQLVVYRFNKPDLVITPVQYDGNNLIFSCKEWNPQGYLKDISYGSLKDLIATTYDP